MKIRKFWKSGNKNKIENLEEKLAEIARFCESRMNFVNSNKRSIKGFYRVHLFESAVENLRKGHSLFSDYEGCFVLGAYNPDYEALQIYCQRMIWALYQCKIRTS